MVETSSRMPAALTAGRARKTSRSLVIFHFCFSIFVYCLFAHGPTEPLQELRHTNVKPDANYERAVATEQVPPSVFPIVVATVGIDVSTHSHRIISAQTVSRISPTEVRRIFHRSGIIVLSILFTLGSRDGFGFPQGSRTCRPKWLSRLGVPWSQSRGRRCPYGTTARYRSRSCRVPPQ